MSSYRGVSKALGAVLTVLHAVPEAFSKKKMTINQGIEFYQARQGSKAPQKAFAVSFASVGRRTPSPRQGLAMALSKPI